MSEVTDRMLELLPDARLHKFDKDGEDRQLIVWGPPGTGKTTSLMTILDSLLQKGAPSQEVMVSTFTRNARAEVKTRLGTKFGLGEEDLPWVRTIHSTAYRLLDLDSEHVMGPAALKQFSEESGYDLKGQLLQRSLDDPFGSVSVETFGDWCYVAEELRRAKLMTYKEAAEQLRPPAEQAYGWGPVEAEAFSKVYSRWKRTNRFYDFTDMLEMTLEEELRPPVNWMLVDEAQDLTPLQWKVIDLWARGIFRLWIFGDDDQAIYQFAGADPAALWARPGHQFVLSHSYRLRSQVHAEAQRIIRGTRARVAKQFDPHEPGGTVDSRWSWEEVDFTGKGSWLLLCRNRYFIQECRATLVGQGLPFRDRTSRAGIPDPNSTLGRAISAAIELGGGGMISKRATIRYLKKHTKQALWPEDRIGARASATLTDLLDMGATPAMVNRLVDDPLGVISMDSAEYHYLRRVFKRDPAAVTSKAPIEISTIHGVKGEEADHVVASPSMTRRTYEDYRLDGDSETRVFYVAATRAKQSLTWLKGGSRFFYDL